ncbi:DUF4158 domain-containing protein [Nonomuraea sp. NPDC048881]|uniref:DUF4158 domain-containing protein n=1 Tax=Nonomuraea sp. NPDC048881 TaxID=3155030 RepID=UPI0033ED0838
MEQFFRLDRSALDALASKRHPAMKLGWAVQWGTVRMLGVFLTGDPLAVPPEAAWTTWPPAGTPVAVPGRTASMPWPVFLPGAPATNSPLPSR